MATTRGVRKSSENILARGRAIIVTEKDKDKYKWGEIPNGSKFIDTTTGIEKVKLEGQSDWVPAGIKNDGTLNIAKDTRIAMETFVIKQLNVPGKPGEFIYLYDGKSDAAYVRHGVILYQNEQGQYGNYNEYGIYKTWAECKRYMNIENNSLESRYKNKTQIGYVFNLEKGDYGLMRNQLQIVIDDCLLRNSYTGGLVELDVTRFCLTKENLLEDGMKISARYFHHFRVGNPYPRIFADKSEPKVAEYNDIWMDWDGTLDDDDPLGDHIEADNLISWDRIRASSRPTSLAGYGIKDNVAYKGHVHTTKEITDFPKTMTANGGHADTATKANQAINATLADTALKANLADKATADASGRNIVATYLTKTDASTTYATKVEVNNNIKTKVDAIQGQIGNCRFSIGPSAPANPQNDKTVWFCTAAGASSIRVYTGNKWKILGAAWEA